MVRGWFPEMADTRLRQTTWPEIDKHRGYIGAMLAAGVSKATIWQRLRDEHGLTASVASLKRYVAANLPDEGQRARVTVLRADPPPGEEAQPVPQGGLPDQHDGERGSGVHVVVGQKPDGFELVIVEQVGLIDDEHGVAATFGVLGCQRVGGLRCQPGGVKRRGVPEGGHDVGQHAAHPDGGVGQVDDDVPGRVQRGGRRTDGHRFAGTDFPGDDPDGALVHAPADPGDGFAVGGVAVQHRWCQVASERHPGESPM